MTILGGAGAERLLGRGDFIFSAAGHPVIRLQGYRAGRALSSALSYLVWPGEAPLPSVVDEWVRRELAAGTGSETGTAVNLAPLHMTVSTPRMVISLGEPNVRA